MQELPRFPADVFDDWYDAFATRRNYPVTVFIRTIFRVMAISGAIVDGDHAIKTRVFRFLMDEPYPLRCKNWWSNYGLYLMRYTKSETVAMRALLMNWCDLAGAIIDLKSL